VEYHDALAKLERDGNVLAQDDALTEQARAAFAQLFEPFTPAALRESVQGVYAERLYFNDTLKTLYTRDDLAAYLAQTAEAVADCQVTVDEWIPGAIGWFVRWRMMLRFKRLRGGRATHSIGISHIVFDRDGRIALHQDFWDAASGLFEHIPVVGGLIRAIRQRM